MFKKKFFTLGVLIILLIACIAFLIVLFGCTPKRLANSGAANPSTSAGAPAPGDSANGTAADQAQPPAVTEWQLPVIVSITGADSRAGLAAAWGFDYGVKAVNEQGGIRGVPVKITIRDAASSDTEATNEIDLATADALIIFGPPTEELYTAGDQAFFDAGTPTVGAATDETKRAALQPFAISCISDPGSEAVSAIDAWAQATKFTKACMIYSSANEARAGLAEAELTAQGKEVVDKIEFNGGIFDAAGTADTAYNSGADAWYIDLAGDDSLSLVEQLRSLAGDTTGKLNILCGQAAISSILLDPTTQAGLSGIRVWTTLDPTKDVEKRKTFDDAFNKNVDDPDYYSVAVDYYQAALMLKQAVDTLGLTGAAAALPAEREQLAEYLYNTGLISTDQGDFVIQNGNKLIASKIYRVTDKGFQQ